MLHKIKDLKWTDHQGQKVPSEYVSDYDKKKEKVLSYLLKRAEKVSQELTELKSSMFERGDKLYREMLEKSGVDVSERKGNYTVFSFDKSVKMEVNISNRIEFDDRINAAQVVINEYLEEKTQGVDHDIIQLINNAFKTTKGRLDSKRILGLFQLKIEHPKWLQAMELIKESMSTNNTARYIALYTRDENGKYQPVQLNLSSI